MDGNSLPARAGGWPASARGYVEGLQTEMRRVTWPSWTQVRATTLVVIVAVFVFAAYFALVDAVLGKAVTKLFETFAR